MGSKGMFQEFMDRRMHLKAVYVASSDEDGQPNCAPAIVIDIVKPDKVYFIDFKSSYTYANLRCNKLMSLAFMDNKSFSGFKLNGSSEVLEEGGEYELLKSKLLKKISAYQAERMIERITGILSRQPAEMTLPPDYVIVKFTARETKDAVGGKVGNPISKMAALQMRIDELEKSGVRHKQGEQAMKAARDFFKIRSESFEKKGLEDELTGLYNRRGFVVLAEQQLKAAQRSGKGTFLIFSDVDHLKSINDTFGHAMGNKALADTARILKDTFRDSDIVARIGGDEFAIALTDSSAEAAGRAAERLMKKIDEHNQSENDPYPLKLSFGVASSQPNDPASLEELLDRADRMMYEEKRKKYGNSGSL